MKWDNLEVLLDRYYEAETTQEEEDYLRDYFKQPNLPAALKPAQAYFQFMAAQRAEKLTGYRSDEWLFAKIEELKGRQFFLKPDAFAFLLRVAAGVALVLVGFWLGSRSPYGEAARSAETALRRELPARPPALSPVTATASERLQVVRRAAAQAPADQVGVQSLINALNFDPNVNVRLAAGEALFRYRQLPGVREAYVQSLSIQTDPNVQALLIDILVALKEKQAVEPFKKLVQQQNLQPTVKLKAQQAIGILI